MCSLTVVNVISSLHQAKASPMGSVSLVGLNMVHQRR
jgi:hypothetical protein